MIVMIWMLNMTNIYHQKKKDNLRKTIKMMKWLKDTEKKQKNLLPHPRKEKRTQIYNK